ncbi:type VI secretion system-associated FHA domain protein TagH [Shewanella sp. MMG014]|uniref:type VI secretion system-associated FHA domain protein TagH n=1 Tax=Shewanella sp. MMG014 TaxID=2822691 RepID=UPI001B392FA4|nr:type VI secretion system-associated FHA domain protein TagH [Shewanella sp. MMG014]MBQ4892183.1 type VI secretion system-associated FHA domain protein TagH [Shewanella sp. MMG014]
MDKTISLNIVNSQMLESGLVPFVNFTQEGGVLGCDINADWCLKGRSGEIKPQHCRIMWVDDQFCLEDLCGEVFVNNSSLPIGLGRLASLNENDEIKIGLYKVRISLGLSSVPSASMTKGFPEIFSEIVLPGLMKEPVSQVIERSGDTSIDDPMLALDALQNRSGENLLSFDSTKEKKLDDINLIDTDISMSDRELTMQADSEYTQDSAIALKKNTELDGFTMDEKTLDLLESELHTGLDKNNEQLGEHITTGPLFRGLGVHIATSQNSEYMQDLSVDFGAALKAAITGILSLHHTANHSRYELMNKNLQPIEDNPLRLGLGYEDTVKTLFAHDRSPVHLSSAAAISESLKSIEHHNEAVQSAITEALDYILGAFSPAKLLKRFTQYRKSSVLNLETEDKWAWSMYEQYYEELTSNRQKGFEKLFWEVFEQAYDRKLREIQKDL